MGAGKAKFLRKGKVPAFATFVRESPKRKELLPEWRSAHKGLGKMWKGMDKAAKAKYVTASKQIKGPYEQHMKAYRSKRHALLKSMGVARVAKRAAKKERKIKRIQVKKLKSARTKAKKTMKRKGKKSSKKAKKTKSTLRKAKKTLKRKGKTFTKKARKHISRKKQKK